MGKINGVHHIALKPNKEVYAKAVDFYSNVLGCEIVRQWGEGDESGCMLSCGDNTVMEILHGDYDGTKNFGAHNHIAFSVDEVDSFLEEIRAAGYEVTMEPTEVNIGGTYLVRVAFFMGPVGESVELFKEL